MEKLETKVIKISYNGRPLELPEGSVLSALLELQGISSRYVAVAVNHAIVPAPARASHVLHEGDEVLVISAIKGG